MSRKLTTERITELMKELYEAKPVKNNRAFTMVTGKAGMEAVNRAIKVQVTLNKLELLIKERVVSETEVLKLREMINSPDEENLNLAVIIMEQIDDSRSKYLKPRAPGRIS